MTLLTLILMLCHSGSELTEPLSKTRETTDSDSESALDHDGNEVAEMPHTTISSHLSDSSTMDGSTSTAAVNTSSLSDR